MNYKLFILILITLFFFSTSSVLARAALVQNYIDAYSFTFFRLFSGSIVLLIILYIRDKKLNLSLKKTGLVLLCFFYMLLHFHILT